MRQIEPSHQHVEPGIAAKGIESRINFQEDESIAAVVNGFSQGLKRAIHFACALVAERHFIVGAMSVGIVLRFGRSTSPQNSVPKDVCQREHQSAAP